MAPRAELRITLEGKVEQVEQALAAVQRATEALRRGELQSVAPALRLRDAPETSAALAALEKLAGREPELRELLDAFERARRALVEQLTRHAEALGLEGKGPIAAAEALAGETVLYRYRPSALLAALLLVALGFGLAVSWWVGLFGWVLTGAVALVAYRHLRAPRLVVTSGRIVMEREVIRVSEVRALRIVGVRELKHRGTRQHLEVFTLFHFTLEAQGLLTVQLGRVPTDFRHALCQLGFPVSFEGML